MMRSVAVIQSPLVFGEVLYDIFPDGRAVLGGAPFNVAWHLQGFGLRPLLISRVGDDGLGRQILAHMAEWDLDTRGVQVDRLHPTGRVAVTIDGDEPCFNIVADQAYDFIEWQPLVDGLSDFTPSLLYRGTLIERTEVAAVSLRDLSAKIDRPVFLDVNLRRPWWQMEAVQKAMRAARWVKLNEDELHQLQPSPQQAQEAALALCRRCSLALLMVTQGAEGAFLCFPDGQTMGAQPPAETAVVDTVGAGDAFSAVAILGLLVDWQPREILTRALDFAAAICRQQGAVALNRSLYRRFIDEWGLGGA